MGGFGDMYREKYERGYLWGRFIDESRYVNTL
jgi:hypothetical protein